MGIKQLEKHGKTYLVVERSILTKTRCTTYVWWNTGIWTPVTTISEKSSYLMHFIIVISTVGPVLVLHCSCSTKYLAMLGFCYSISSIRTGSLLFKTSSASFSPYFLSQNWEIRWELFIAFKTPLNLVKSGLQRWFAITCRCFLVDDGQRPSSTR